MTATKGSGGRPGLLTASGTWALGTWLPISLGQTRGHLYAFTNFSAVWGFSWRFVKARRFTVTCCQAFC